jgi:hypothetical protein
MAKEIVRASLDRFEENDLAVVYADDGRKFDVPRGLIPKDAKEGARLKLQLRDSEVTRIIVNHEDTSQLQRKIKEKLERLKHNQYWDR